MAGRRGGRGGRFCPRLRRYPPIGHRITLVVYLAGKAIFTILIVSGARHHIRPGSEPSMHPVFLMVFVSSWSLILGFAVPSLWQAQLAESFLVGTIFLVGGATVLRHPRSVVSRWLGWAMLFEGIIFAYSAVLLVPALWGNTPGFAYLSYSSFIDAWAELMLALACIAVLADRREELLHYANRELLESQQRLSRLVDTDPLTNLANRRSLRKAMDSVIDTGGAVIFIDINDFKQINDLFGHRVGDATLQRLAKHIVEQFRPEDHVIRWGGDEFLVVAPGMDQTQRQGQDRGHRRSRCAGTAKTVRRFRSPPGSPNSSPGATPRRPSKRLTAECTPRSAAGSAPCPIDSIRCRRIASVRGSPLN